MNLLSAFLFDQNRSLHGEGALAALRERIFGAMMLVVIVPCCILYVVLMRSALARSHWIDISFFTLVLGLVLSITFIRRIPYMLRSVTVLLIVYFITVYSLAQSGLSGHGRIFVLTFIIMSALLLGSRFWAISLLLSLATLAVFSAGMSTGWIPAPPPGLNGNASSQLDWMITILFIIVTSTLTTVPLLFIVHNLQTGLGKQKELALNLEEERNSLESRIARRTADLERRMEAIRIVADISRSISSVLDPETLLQNVVDQLTRRIGLYYAGVFLLDDTGTFAVLRAGSGSAGQAMIAEGHRLQVGGTSMIGWTTSNHQPRIALDVGAEAVRFNNPHLPLTRSELALPITSKNKVLGALSIQSEMPNAFDQDDILILQGIADSLAIAIENARLFQQTQLDLEEIRTLNRQYLEQAWTEANISGGLKYTYENPLARHGAVSTSMEVPVLVRDQPIGRITLDTGGKQLTPEEMAMVDAIAAQTALALESARLLEETQRRAIQEEKINQMTAQFSRATEVEDVLQMAIKTLGQLPAISEVSVHLMPTGQNNGGQPARSNGKPQESAL